MPPRFVELRRVPRDNETVSAVIETFSTVCYEKIGATIETIRTSSWTYGWSVFGMTGWVAESVTEWTAKWKISIPRSSIVCFSCALLCICIYLVMAVYLSIREWKRLRRVYEN